MAVLLLQIRNRLTLNNALLALVSTDSEVMVAEIRDAHRSQELLVMGNDNKLEVGLLHACLDYGVQRFSQTFDVL